MSYAGTVCYMAPEVAGTHSYTEKVDVYSFGITFWEVMSRKTPFYHMEIHRSVYVKRKTAEEDRPPIDDIRNIPKSQQIIELIERCWNGDAYKRPTMQEIIRNINILYSIKEMEEPYLNLKIPDTNNEEVVLHEVTDDSKTIHILVVCVWESDIPATKETNLLFPEIEVEVVTDDEKAVEHILFCVSESEIPATINLLSPEIDMIEEVKDDEMTVEHI